MQEPLRLTEILTTSTAVANYLGSRTVEADHVQAAVEMLLGTKSMDDFGRPQSPLLSRVTGAGSGVAPAVRELAVRWFSRLGEDVQRELTDNELAEFLAELKELF